MPDFCNTTCQLHTTQVDKIDKHDCILNGEHGDVGIVGKLNTVIENQKLHQTRLDGIDAKFWKATVMIICGLGLSTLNLFLLLAAQWGKTP